jgi:hypothetical protein
VEFNGVELAGGAELATLVEKVVTGPVEKAVVGPCVGEDRGGREARWRGMKMGCCALVQRRCRPAEWRRDGEGGTVEREARWRASSPRRHGGVRSWRAVAALR